MVKIIMIKARKSLGQNFLVNPHILDKIISAAEISKEDIILEVGPGTGLLTKKLAEKAGRVIAIEKDQRLIEPLRETFKSYPNIEIIEGDILKLPIANYQVPDHYKIVANIPYYITSNFLRTVFEEWPQPKLIVLTIQKEVAQRIIAKPPHMNLLALSVQYYSEPKIIGYVSKNNFRPIPKVDSAIIKLVPRIFGVEPRPLGEARSERAAQGFPEVRPRNDQELFELMRAGFSEKRKQLMPTLSRRLTVNKEKIHNIFEKIGLSDKIRAENLSLEQWQKLNNYLSNL